MAIVVGDLGEENEQLAQAMVQGLTEAQVMYCRCWSTAPSLTLLLSGLVTNSQCPQGSGVQLSNTPRWGCSVFKLVNKARLARAVMVGAEA